MVFPARLGGARNVTGDDADRGHPDVDQVFGGQLRQDLPSISLSRNADT
jgi:hypothetical protein